MSLTGVPDGRVGSAPSDSAGGYLEELTAEYELPIARMHHTAARPGSPHFICRADPSRPPKNAPLNPSRYPGIDIKIGRGSMIVAPGSIINGRPYEVVSATELTLAPPWLSEIQEADQYPRQLRFGPNTLFTERTFDVKDGVIDRVSVRHVAR
ncbi:bifunctional DNA primase/polymerase [Streptomyces sp. NPDC127020]|uniref:bifunctional DNA primase/polymerase n=1 Tax=Streptomyces sp. NPDC127020 TaxID=3347109 RepID=UPI0036507037